MTNRIPTPIPSLAFSEKSPLFDGDDDDFTITAYGDISLSNIDFVPGLPSAPSPIRKPSTSTSTLSNSSKALSLLNASPARPSPAKNHPLPDVIKKILPPSPSKTGLVRDLRDFDFKTLVNMAREAHSRRRSAGGEEERTIKAQEPRMGAAVLKKPTLTASEAARRSLLLPARRPRPPKKHSGQATKGKDGERSQERAKTVENQDSAEDDDSPTIRPGAEQLQRQQEPQSSSSQQVASPAGGVPRHEATKASPSPRPVPPKKPRVASPKKGTRPLRGNAPLPRRPPLPRWDFPPDYVNGGWITLHDELASSLASVSMVRHS